MNTPRFRNALLIDDNEINNMMQEQVIKTAGFSENIVTKQSGMEALEYLQNEVTEANTPDVIFLDIRMPILDGFAFLEEYKKLPEFITGKAKIVILTSSLEEQDSKRAKTYPYVIDYIIKPLTFDRLETIQG